MGETGRDLNAVASRVVGDLLERSHLVPPDEIAGSVAGAAAPLGVSSACIYLADLEQENLRAVSGSPAGTPDVLAIDSTLAGRAYVTVCPQYAPVWQRAARLAGLAATDWRHRAPRRP